MISIKFDSARAQAFLDDFEEAAKKAVRPAAYAGAKVLYDEVKLNVSKMGRVTGNLYSSIYHAFSKDNSGDGVATYHISWNHRKAPHGHLLEYGHIQKFVRYVGSDGKWYTDKSKPLPQPKHVGARPFLRPAFDAKGKDALEGCARRYIEALEEQIGDRI